MKATNVVILNEWVLNNKAHLASSDRGTLQTCAAKASSDLGFKVPASALRELMQSQGLETRRLSATKSKELSMTGEIEKLTAENMELRRTLAKVAASDYVPDDFKEFVFAGLKEEVKSAIFCTD
tara:strand:- start:567 stop:938 length:372 start_codon:yes stop_codon:yes gene_type:complete